MLGLSDKSNRFDKSVRRTFGDFAIFFFIYTLYSAMENPEQSKEKPKRLTAAERLAKLKEEEEADKQRQLERLRKAYYFFFFFRFLFRLT